MAGRILDVTAHTTLDYVETAVRGPTWTDRGAGVLDVDTPTDDPDDVVLSLEVDHTASDHVTPHADRITLTADQARELASELEAAADADESDRPRRLQS